MREYTIFLYTLGMGCMATALAQKKHISPGQKSGTNLTCEKSSCGSVSLQPNCLINLSYIRELSK